MSRHPDWPGDRAESSGGASTAARLLRVHGEGVPAAATLPCPTRPSLRVPCRKLFPPLMPLGTRRRVADKGHVPVPLVFCRELKPAESWPGEPRFREPRAGCDHWVGSITRVTVRQRCPGELQQELGAPGCCRLCLHGGHSHTEPPRSQDLGWDQQPLAKQGHGLQRVSSAGKSLG